MAEETDVCFIVKDHNGQSRLSVNFVYTQLGTKFLA
jgi:hypothetical protein